MDSAVILRADSILLLKGKRDNYGNNTACHFTEARDTQVSFAPLKDVRIDNEGTLRLGWWKENEKMKHRPIAVERSVDSNAAVALLGNSFDTKQGIIIEGALRLPKAKDL
jgi:hypothetical protein